MISSPSRRRRAPPPPSRSRSRRPAAAFLVVSAAAIAAAAASTAMRSFHSRPASSRGVVVASCSVFFASAYQQSRQSRQSRPARSGRGRGADSPIHPTFTASTSTSISTATATETASSSSPPLPNLEPRRTHFAPHIRRVLCVSDLHTDYDDNLRWAEETVDSDREALLLVAGDVSHDPAVVRRTLAALRGKFGEVAYVPGNHDLWVGGGGGANDGIISDSVDKLMHLLDLCDEEDVRTGPVRIGDPGGSGGRGGVWAVPLLSWHHQSFDTEPDIDPSCWGGIPDIERCMTDYRRAVWPEPLSAMDDSVAEYVDGINDLLLADAANSDLDDDEEEEGRRAAAIIGGDGSPVLTFSHFLPRIELTLEKRYLLVPTLNKAVGSVYLERRLRELGSSLHVFGHTHFGWDQDLDGVRYVQAALAYPRERARRARSLQIGTMSPAGAATGGLPTKEEEGRVEERLHPVCVWDADNIKDATSNSEGRGRGGGFPDQRLGGYWSDRYSHVPRRPEVTRALAPWVAGRYRQLPGGEVEEFVRHEESTREPSPRLR